MITVYLLPVETLNGCDVVAGAEHIHDAVLECTENPNVRKLIMDTTLDEEIALSDVALNVYLPDSEELAIYNAREIAPPPDADALRAAELLAMSPPVITLPEIWELLRIFGRRLGYDF